MPDNNGRVGMLGVSYPGWYTTMALVAREGSEISGDDLSTLRGKRVAADHEVERVAGKGRLERSDGVDRVGDALAPQLDVRHLEGDVVFGRQARHRQAVFRRDQAGGVLVRGLPVRDPEHPVQTELLPYRLGHDEVRDVGRVERTAEDPDVHPSCDLRTSTFEPRASYELPASCCRSATARS